MKKINAGCSSEENKFTPSQLDQLRALAELSNKIESKEIPYIKSYTKTTHRYPFEGIYVLEFEDGIKVGRSKNIKDRIASYDKPWCKSIISSTFYYCDFTVTLEQEILNKSKDYIDYHSNSQEWIVGISYKEMISRVDKVINIKDCKNQHFKAFLEGEL